MKRLKKEEIQRLKNRKIEELLIIVGTILKLLLTVLGLGIILITIGNLYNLPTPSVLDCVLIAIGISLIKFKINLKL